MLAIRMRRLGAKKRPFFRVVVIDSHASRDGRSVEVLGHYNPTSQPELLTINRDRLDHWVSKGAQPSDTVRTLLGRHPAGEEPAVETPTPTPAPAPAVAAATASAPAPAPAPAPAQAPAEEAAPAPETSSEPDAAVEPDAAADKDPAS